MPPFQTLISEIVWQCPWYAVRRDEILLPNGEHAEYNVVVKNQAVWILPITAQGEIVLVRQYRHTVDDWCWELPAGGVKPGQSLEEAAREELHEEIGGLAEKLTYGGQFYTANGICNEVGHYFLADQVSLGQPSPEPVEVMSVHPLPIVEVYRMARSGQITDASSLLVLLLCEPHLL
ncbi:MAG TPA: NUDIX hydrolase [Chloroflexota bacterium]|nr:NUDIX hydrolase [Chloroflexota bacterium]